MKISTRLLAIILLKNKFMLLVAVCLFVWPVQDCMAQKIMLPQGVPTLDEMAGDWLTMASVGNPPDVNNFNQMLVVNRDLTSFFFNPGGLYTRRSVVEKLKDSKDKITGNYTNQWKDGYPLVKLYINDTEYAATEARWYAYRALRRNLNCNGLIIETDTRMVNEQRGVLCAIDLTNNTKDAREIQLELKMPGTNMAGGSMVINKFNHPGRTSYLLPSSSPDKVVVGDSMVVWRWKLNIPSGKTIKLGFAAGDEDDRKAVNANKNVTEWASHLDNEMEAFKLVWEKRWADAFTPGNNHFSGNLPVLKTVDQALKRNYYMGILTMLILERTQFAVHPRSFITSGERGDGIQYYWDASMQSTVWALLEPNGMKAVLRRWLVQNPRVGAHMSLNVDTGFDKKYYDSIKGYAANACTIFKTADEYLSVTGDRAFLNEKLINGKTVLQNMDAIATDWETLNKGPKGLVNYGGNGNLLECGPAYINCIASLNAQNIWMMRRMAELQANQGNLMRAKELREKAIAFLPTVMTLYNADLGTWNAYHADGKLTEVRHCVDYIYAGNALANDLTPVQKLSMNNFVKHELFMRDWMRAMSQKDPNAAFSTRPDHSPTGAYDGWVPLSVATMWRLGDAKSAYHFYCNTAVVTKEGPFAQDHEFYGDSPGTYDAPVRVAMRGGSMKECISGVAFADVVVNTFFGFMPSNDGSKLLTDDKISRPFNGTLSHIRYGKSLYQINADRKGLHIAAEKH